MIKFSPVKLKPVKAEELLEKIYDHLTPTEHVASAELFIME